MEFFRRKFERFSDLYKKHARSKAIEILIDQESEREKKQMGPLIENSSFYEALSKAVPMFEKLGMKMSVVDLSNGSKDAVLEIQKYCPYKEIAKEFTENRPCDIACEVDIKAVEKAFPGVEGRLLCSQADNDCTCVFKYQRDR